MRGLAADERKVTLADGSRSVVPYAGPVRIAFANRQCFTGAMIAGDEVVLGVIPMKDMDLVIEPMTLEITVNPDSPNIPAGRMKWAGRIDRRPTSRSFKARY